MLKKIINKLLKLIKWIWTECRDYRTLIIFIIVWLIVMSPMFVGYILYFITNNKWHLTYANGWILFWAGPLTPAIPLCLTITFSIKKLINKKKRKC